MARTKRVPHALANPADHGPAERAQHDTLLPHATEAAGVVGKRVKHECRLDWYVDKGSIVDRQHEAGLRFRRDWLLAVATQRMIGTYGPRMSGGQDFTTAQLAARGRVGRVMACLGRDVAPIVVDVCCFDRWASGGLPILRDGLTALADHYGIPRAAAD
jgi:hypothetical protein